MPLSILLSSSCCWWARFLRWTLIDASKYSFGILTFCSHILSVLMTETPHRRGTLDYLLILTCGVMKVGLDMGEIIYFSNEIAKA